MKKFNISIPEPCHEDWGKMKPEEKGRFCTPCSKTVVDFTQKSTEEIQEYLVENQDKRICGHFYRKQLDSIVLQIPETTFHKQLSFQKVFILTLLFVMGTTLFSCKTDNGKTQKIEKVELIDSIIKKEAPQFLGRIPSVKESCKNDSLSNITTGVIVETGELASDVIDIFPFNIVDIPPRFKGTKVSTKENLNKEFNERMRNFVAKNFDVKSAMCLNLSKGKKRIFARFTINKEGKIENIETRAPHPVLKKKVEELIKKLPNFIPAKQNGKSVNVRYVQPITFVVE